MSARLNLVTEPTFVSLRSVLYDRLNRLGDEIHAAQFAELLDPVLRGIMEKGFTEAGAHEGTVWLVDASGEFLEPAFNTGPRAAQIVGQFKQPLGSGLISMVFASEQPFVENDVSKNKQQSKLLDTRLEVATQSLLAVPLHFLNACRGVVSCVQLRSNGQTDSVPGFQAAHLDAVQSATSLLSQMVEYRLLSRTVGWNCE